MFTNNSTIIHINAYIIGLNFETSFIKPYPGAYLHTTDRAQGQVSTTVVARLQRLP